MGGDGDGDGGGNGGYYRDIMGFGVKGVENVVEFPYTTNADFQIYVIRK